MKEEKKKKNANETKKRKQNKIKQNSGLNLLWRAPKCSALRGTKSHGPEGRYLAGQGLLVGSLFKKGIPLSSPSLSAIFFCPPSLEELNKNNIGLGNTILGMVEGE